MTEQQEIDYKAIPSEKLALFNSSAAVFIVLYEDLYETQYGDGRYLYPSAAFLDEASAETFRQSKQSEKGMKYSLKRLDVVVDDSRRKVVAKIEREDFERYSLQDVISLLAAH